MINYSKEQINLKIHIIIMDIIVVVEEDEEVWQN